MKRNAFSEDTVVDMSRRVIRNFYALDKEPLAADLSESFMWIGTNDKHWSENLDEFSCAVKNLCGISPVTLSDEEYHLLFHERNIWILYGRHKVTFTADRDVVHVHMRFTFVWKRYNDELKLLHLHASRSGDVPARQGLDREKSGDKDSPLMQHFEKILSLPSSSRRLVFKDLNGVHRYLLPGEVVYLEADLQRTTVHTKTESFSIHGLISEIEKSMPDDFYRIHKSYLLNTSYVESIFRYKVKLQDGSLLPIGRDRYMSFKKYLSEKNL